LMRTKAFRQKWINYNVHNNNSCIFHLLWYINKKKLMINQQITFRKVYKGWIQIG
jgi:hypothetical protein